MANAAFGGYARSLTQVKAAAVTQPIDGGNGNFVSEDRFDQERPIAANSCAEPFSSSHLSAGCPRQEKTHPVLIIT